MASQSEHDLRRVRAAKNQSMFREVNERLDELAHEWGKHCSYMCECLDLGCAEMIPLSHLEYEQLRQEPNRFVVVPGHENAEVEEVTARNSRYLVVRKLGVGGEVAAASDPRSGDA